MNLFFKHPTYNITKEFSQLFHNYYVNLCRFAFTFTNDELTAEEIVQEVFITLWEKQESLQIHTSIRSFLYTSVRNRALNFLRDLKTRQVHEDIYAKDSCTSVSLIHPSIENDQLEQQILEAIAELPEKCKRIFILHRNKNLTYQQIAHQLDISPKTVENQMGIALKKLKNKLSPFLNTFFSLL